ncbi:MAG: hypothetical protein GF335_02985 [Candidatus Moranbacteria bacterium]|nr:hypothetical protein [Candidatus Moranbacteria bacterium]
MTKNKTKKEKKSFKDQEKNELKPEKSETGNSKSGFLKGCLIGGGVIFASFSVLVLAGVLIYFLALKDKKEDLGKSDLEKPLQSSPVASLKPASESSYEKMLEYKDEEFGIKINLPSTWKGYDVKKELMGGDFQIGSLDFFYPTANLDSQANGNSDSGFVEIFNIGVFLKESFDDPARDKTHDELQYGKIIGRNNDYVFTFSHINGDIQGYPEIGRDLSMIEENIEIVSSAGKISAVEDPDFLVDSSTSKDQQEDSITAAELNSYKNSSIAYPNCKHQYRIYYPREWSNNSMTNKSDQVRLYGDNITVNVNAFYNSNNLTLDRFADQRIKLISGQLINSLEKFRSGARIKAYSYQNPKILLLFWQNGSYNLELKITGSGIARDERAMGKFLAAINFYDPDIASCSNVGNNNYQPQNYNVYHENYDTDIDNYDAGGDVPYCDYENDPDCWPQGEFPDEFDCDNWQHPNGDIQYWWDSVSDEERDCYIDKYGNPDL